METTKTSEPNNKEPQKQNYVKSIIIFVVFFAAAFFGTKLIMKPSVDKELEKVVAETNKNCPMSLDQYTTLKNVVTLPNKTIQYNCQLNQITKAEIDMKIVKENVFPQLLKNAKENPQVKSFRDNDVTIKYNYVDKNGEFVTEYVITPEMYQ